MASAAQERANRLNATRSTGARTEAGKEKTKFNATRHGLTSRQVVLFSEDKEDYEELRRQQAGTGAGAENGASDGAGWRYRAGARCRARGALRVGLRLLRIA